MPKSKVYRVGQKRLCSAKTSSLSGPAQNDIKPVCVDLAVQAVRQLLWLDRSARSTESSRDLEATHLAKRLRRYDLIRYSLLRRLRFFKHLCRLTVDLEVAGGTVGNAFARCVLDVGFVLFQQLALGRSGLVALQDLRSPPKALKHFDEAVNDEARSRSLHDVLDPGLKRTVFIVLSKELEDVALFKAGDLQQRVGQPGLVFCEDNEVRQRARRHGLPVLACLDQLRRQPRSA